ncbi:hypothetical protein TNCV_311011 [Trichonephila clavipes]|nr:hypothetical protein TNCV_311011 [Trichonephila clavipes]
MNDFSSSPYLLTETNRVDSVEPRSPLAGTSQYFASIQHLSSNHYENWHVYVFFGEGFCAILFVAAPHQSVIQPINFCNVQSIVKCQNDHQLGSTLTFRCVSIESPL